MPERAVLYTQERFSGICGQFNVYIFHELSSNYVTLLNADAFLYMSLKCYVFI